jgi:hypothetical protein
VKAFTKRFRGNVAGIAVGSLSSGLSCPRQISTFSGAAAMHIYASEPIADRVKHGLVGQPRGSSWH